MGRGRKMGTPSPEPDMSGFSLVDSIRAREEGNASRRERRIHGDALDWPMPQAQLDFHDRGELTPHDIVEGLRDFVRESVGNGLRYVLVITGKGKSSEGGRPVVKPTVGRELGKLRDVARFRIARNFNGGGGAYEVELRID